MKLPRLLPVIAAALIGTMAGPALAQAAPEQAAPAAEEPEIPSAEFIIANLDTISPVNLIHVVDQYWSRGDRLQAAFWFYIWQIRTMPWAELDPQIAPIRAQMDSQAGAIINGWIASDTDLLLDTMKRAISYEPKLPLVDARPEGLPSAFWLEKVQTSRDLFSAEVTTTLTPEFFATINTARQEQGAPVGPLTDIGTPLPAEWR